MTAKAEQRAATEEPDYARLLAFREALRRFRHWTENEAKALGVTPAQHQLMLTVRGHASHRGPTIGEIADSLILRHHSVVELVDRAALAGLVMRHPDPQDARTIRVRLTPRGSRLLRRLSIVHQDEVRRLSALLRPFLDSN
jgi:DNA-binding MarR family transcriptional regulator